MRNRTPCGNSVVAATFAYIGDDARKHQIGLIHSL
jgi:hypothetical protein